MQYTPTVDLNNENSSHTLFIRQVGQYQNVLDVGCARGYTGAILVHQFQCTMSGLEYDPAAADIARQIYQEVVVGDVEDLTLFDRLQHRPFDVVLFGDILEHLRQPERVLRFTRSLLKPDGFVLISLPNVVTLRLRLRFLLGHFDYTDQGIMDRTHLRFFTLKTAQDMIRACGYTIEHLEYVIGPNFGKRLQQLRIPRHWIPPTLLGTQFIFKARSSARS